MFNQAAQATTPQLPPPAGMSAPPALGPPTPAPYVGGGLVKMVSLKQLTDEEQRSTQAQQHQPIIQGLAAHVRQQFMTARQARLNAGVEERMLRNLRARRGEYDPEVMAEIRKTGGSEIYMMLTSTKCRAVGAWLRDVFLGIKDEKCWTVDPTPMPDLPDNLKQSCLAHVQEQAQAWAAIGQPPTPAMIEDAHQMVCDRTLAQVKDLAKQVMLRMEAKMEDQTVEGLWLEALNAFLDDLTTFPAAILKGPVVRRKPRMQWVNGQVQVDDKLVLEWDRVAPQNCYPSPGATSPNNGAFIERHQLSRDALTALIGVEGYDDNAIKAVLNDYGMGGLREWLTNDMSFAEAAGQSTSSVMQNPDGLIDALQYWGSASGKMLLAWGMDKKQVPEEAKEYQVEVWLIGSWVIKATLNPDPLKRRPYFKASFEDIPGAFWGNAVADLVRDTQRMCNASARAIANNMSIASGPQVWVNVDRMPTGEDVTQMFPWKIWQGTSDPLGSTAQPIVFFQPQSFVGELMQVYQMFSTLADEAASMPKYMTGDSPGGGAGRTSSGLSMLMTNAGKSIKQVVSNIDTWVIKPAIERLYFYNMRYGDDPDLKGDANVVARGANSLTIKDNLQVRRNEFLQSTANPIDMAIIGQSGRGAVLREVARGLDMDTDEIVPSPEQMRINQAQAQQQAAQQEQMQAALQQQQGGGQQGAGSMKGAGAGGAQNNPQGTPRTLQPNGAPAGGVDQRIH